MVYILHFEPSLDILRLRIHQRFFDLRSRGLDLALGLNIWRFGVETLLLNGIVGDGDADHGVRKTRLVRAGVAS